MSQLKVWAYKTSSNGARLLAKHLGCKIIKHENSVFKGNPNTVVVNWGGSEVSDEARKCKLINCPEDVSKVVNRRELLKSLYDRFDVPAFTSDQEVAASWIDNGMELYLKDGVYTEDVKPAVVLRLHNVAGNIIHVERKTEASVEIPKATRRMIDKMVNDVRLFLELDFCAVTVAYRAHDSRVFILNVNTAPQIDEVLASVYANAITFYLENMK